MHSFFEFTFLISRLCYVQISAAKRYKTRVRGQLLALIAGSNTAGDMDVCLLWLLCVVRYRSLRKAHTPSRWVLLTVVCHCVWSRLLYDNGGPGPRWAVMREEEEEEEGGGEKDEDDDNDDDDDDDDDDYVTYLRRFPLCWLWRCCLVSFECGLP